MGRERIRVIRDDGRTTAAEEDTLRRKKKVPSPALNLAAPLSPADIGALQRVAGNRATQAFLVQRQLATKSTALEGFATGGAPGTSLLGKVKGALSGSSFNAIRDALVRYEKAGTSAAKAKHLQDVDRLATKWVNEHAEGLGAIDRRRRTLLTGLLDEIPGELARLSTEQAQGIYMANVTNAMEAPNGTSKDAGKKYALKGLSKESRAMGLQKPNAAGTQFVEAAGLTEAELTAIRIFTADDFKYINPSVKNDQSWLEGNKARKGLAFNRAAPDEAYLEEGRVHAGVMNQALKKLPPDPSVVYRGATQTDAEFKAQVGVGKVFTFPSFASASKDRTTAVDFASRNGKDHALVFRIQNSGGRDISKISAITTEEEVTLLAGSKYSVQSVTTIPPLQPGDKRTWHEVVLAP